MTPAVHIVDAEGAAALAIARELVLEYAAWLGIDLEYQDFSHELATFPGDYAPPRGALLLAQVEAGTAGCVALRPFGPAICEMKRLWVRTEFQGLGIGRALAQAVLERARTLDYARMRLDTLPRMAAALALYRDLGFREIAAYYPSPIPGTVYLEADLGSR
ncbi:MAG TPA: GNAT family N-acetyltransferase [Steroidobacteraceae bacterium]|nr:GNAT family N-acetyltransferase [Steroidobacteraceae bacterium]